MSIAIQFFTVVTRVETIEKKYPGGLASYSDTPYVWHDCQLAASSFMNWLDVDVHICRLQKHRFLFEPERADSELVVVDQARGILGPCHWLEFAIHPDGYGYCWSRGNKPGGVVFPADLSSPALIPTAVFVPAQQELRLPSGKSIIIKQGDITAEATQAIVNPANGHMLHNGGAARAIAMKGGNEVVRQSREAIRQSGPLAAGQAIITGAGNLPCEYVIHAVGPRMGEGNEAVKLEQAAWSALSLAEDHHLRSLSLPAISSGIFGFPKEKCAAILLATAIRFLSQPGIRLKTVVMCNQDEETTRIFVAQIHKH